MVTVMNALFSTFRCLTVFLILVGSYTLAYGATNPAQASAAIPAVQQTTTALSREGAENLMNQMNAVMNSRLPYRIKTFFEYYISPTAQINKKSILVSPEDFEYEQSVEDIKYDRNQYIQSLSKIVTVRGDYTFEASLTNFQLTPDGNSAIISWSAREVTSVQTSDIASSIPTYLHNIVYSNCNASIIDGPSLPVIVNANCIEKIVFN